MRDGRGLDCSRDLEADGVGREVVEEADAVAEQHRDEVDLHLVEQSRPQALLRATNPSSDIEMSNVSWVIPRLLS
jgi:isocitrate/isopropylmalate dehydrogenase